MPDLTALGVALTGDGADVVESGLVEDVLVVASVLSNDGTARLVLLASENVRLWQAVGMAIVLTDRLRAACQEDEDAG